MIVNCIYHKKLDRTFVFAADPEEHKLDRKDASELQNKLAWYLHPKIYGYPRGRGIGELQTILWGHRLEKKYILEIDIVQAFRNVDLKRLKKLIQRFQYGGRYFDRYYTENGAELKIRGLPEGRPQSAVMLALYMTPVMRRFCKQFTAYLYADNLYVALDDKGSVSAAVLLFQECLSKNSHLDRVMEIHEAGKKAPKLYAPTDKFRIAGIVLDGKGDIWPDTNYDYAALNFKNIVEAVRRHCSSEKEIPKKKQILRRIEKFSPINRLYWSFKAGERCVENKCSLDSTSDIPNNSLPSPSYVPSPVPTQGSRKHRVGFGDFVGLAPSSFFTRSEKSHRLKIFRMLNEIDGSQQQNKLAMDAVSPHEDPLDDNGTGRLAGANKDLTFIKNLNCRFVQFHPRSAFTEEFYSKLRERKSYDIILAEKLYENELRLIDDFSYVYRELKFPSDLAWGDFPFGIPERKIRQYLRGWAHYRYIQAHHRDFAFEDVEFIKAIGMLTRPKHHIYSLKEIGNWAKSEKITKSEMWALVKLICWYTTHDRHFQLTELFAFVKESPVENAKELSIDAYIDALVQRLQIRLPSLQIGKDSLLLQ